MPILEQTACINKRRGVKLTNTEEKMTEARVWNQWKLYNIITLDIPENVQYRRSCAQQWSSWHPRLQLLPPGEHWWLDSTRTPRSTHISGLILLWSPNLWARRRVGLSRWCRHYAEHRRAVASFASASPSFLVIPLRRRWLDSTAHVRRTMDHISMYPHACSNNVNSQTKEMQREVAMIMIS